MRCRECGCEVDNEKAFCPNCGTPMKVTADYEYIQAEIANKVDRFFSEEHQDEDDPDRENKPYSGKSDEQEDSVETMAKTRNVYGNDSVFDEDYQPDNRYTEDRYDREEDAEDQPRRRHRNRSTDGSAHQPRKILYQKPDQTTARVITALVIFVIVAIAVVGVLAILGVFNKNQNGGQSQNTAVLSCNLNAGETYEAPVTVSISNPQEGNVFYTLDGTEPTFNSKIYNGPFEISAEDVLSTYPTVRFRATAFSADSEKSGEINMEFFLEYDESVASMIEELQTSTEEETTTALILSPPQISPVAGEYSSDQNILVSSPEGADIYYTYDGSIPNERSTRYMGPVKMRPGSGTFSAICIKDGVSSPVASYAYTLEYGYNTSSDAALDTVRWNLVNNGYVNDSDLNTSNGYARLTHEGVYEISGYTYYVIRVDFFDSDGSLIESMYRGVGVNHGNIYGIEIDENQGYYVTWG